ncbi:MAG: hydroxylamine reductase, partial [Desulfofustis sp.]|nr:hydroxylamine reductase [Desulfofustis sp.]
MFCNQCEQTAKGIGCEKVGVCGKNEGVASLQDLLTHALQGLAIVAVAARKVGIVDPAVDHFTSEATFACLTNVDFDPTRFETWIKKTVELRDSLRARAEGAGATISSDAPALSYRPAADLAGLEAQGVALN